MDVYSNGVANIGFRASSGAVVVHDLADGDRIMTFKQGHASNIDIGLAMTGYAAGYKVARGSNTATATGTITTGLTTITGYAFGMDSIRATTANYCSLVTGKISSGNLKIYKWKHKSATATTLVAATSAATVYWVAVGT